MERHFLDPKQPLIPQAAKYLWDLGDQTNSQQDDSKTQTDSSHSNWDLSKWIVVVPTTRAGNRLLDQLVDLAANQSRDWTPPQITTVGALPELLYEAQFPFASHAVQKFAWLKALFELKQDDIGRLIRDAPSRDLISYWLEISDLLARLHRELASENFEFSDVPKEVRRQSQEAFPDQERWEVLIKLQALYRNQLDKIEIWDRQLARLVAIKKAEDKSANLSEFTNDRNLLLVASADLSKSIRRILGLLKSEVISLVYSSTESPELFDEQGCLNSRAWSNIDQTIPKEKLIVADKPVDQANALVKELIEQSHSYSRDDVAVALTDSNLAPVVQRRLFEAGQPSRYLGGQPIGKSKPVRLLNAIGNYLDSETYADFSALIRHPDVFRWLMQAARKAVAIGGSQDEDESTQSKQKPEHTPHQILQRWDQFQNNYLPHRINAQNLEQLDETDLRRFDFDKIQEWLKPLLSARQRWSSSWEGIRQVLLTIYGTEQLDQEEPDQKETLDAIEAISDAFAELELVPKALHVSLPPADAIRIVLREISAQTLGVPKHQDDLDLLGWLDVPWEDAKLTVVVGFNEGNVPEGEGSDLFLPDQIRSKLGINDNARRYARDAYALSLLRGSHRDLRLILGRHDVEGNPLAPSRLLFSVPDEDVGPLALHLFRQPPVTVDASAEDASSVDTKQTSSEAKDPKRHQQFTLPRPESNCEILTSLSVTRFANYLTCPYRFYLEQITRLEMIDDSADELDAGEFGTLLHAVLERFAKSDLRNSTDADEIAKALREWTDRHAKQKYGDAVQPSVSVQLEQMKHRFNDFSIHQAKRAKDGWEIWKAEGGTLEAAFPVDGKPFTLRGRIDRIDRHSETGEFAVLDYKTSDSRGTPEKSHRPKGIWINLQLPLYRHLVRSLPEIKSSPKLGFVSLPKEGGVGGFHLAPWSEAEMEVADEVARNVIRAIRNRHYWPPSEMSRYDDWEVICQTQTIDRHPEDELVDRTKTQQPVLSTEENS